MSLTCPFSTLDLDRFFLNLLAAKPPLDASLFVASLEFETFKLLFLHGDLSFSLLGSGD